MKKLIDKLYKNKNLEADEFKKIIENINDEELEYLHSLAREVALKSYGKKIVVLGQVITAQIDTGFQKKKFWNAAMRDIN